MQIRVIDCPGFYVTFIRDFGYFIIECFRQTYSVDWD